MVEVRKSCGIAVVPGLCTGHIAFLETLSEPLCSQFWHCGISSVKKKQKNNFAFTAFWYRGKQAINTICTSCFGFAKTWPVFSGKGSYFCLKEIIRILGQFLSVTQSILNLISLVAPDHRQNSCVSPCMKCQHSLESRLWERCKIIKGLFREDRDFPFRATHFRLGPVCVHKLISWALTAKPFEWMTILMYPYSLTDRPLSWPP